MNEALFGDERKQRSSLADFTISFGKVAGKLAIAPYILPSTIRDVRARTPRDLTGEEEAGGQAGFYAAIASYIPQVAFYATNQENLWIPLATNLLSGAYELGRRKGKRVMKNQSRT